MKNKKKYPTKIALLGGLLITLVILGGIGYNMYSSSFMKSANLTDSEVEAFASVTVEGSEQTAGPRKKRSLTSTTTVATTTPTSAVLATPPPTLKTMAWIYPGAPACGATTEIADGRKINTLKAEYFTITAGVMQQISSTEYCNGYSATNIAKLKQYSTEQYVTVSSASAASMAMFLGDETIRKAAVASLTDFVVTNNITGVELDFEDFGGWNADSYALFKVFVTELGTSLHNHSKKLMIDGPAISNTSEQGWYVWRYSDFVNLPVDNIVVMTYDYQFDHGSGQPIAPLDWMRSTMAYISAQYPKSKLVMGIPSYGYQGTIGTYRSTILTHDQIKSKTGYNTAQRDTRSGEMMWTSGTTQYVFQDSESMNKKAAVAIELGIPAISVWHLGGNMWFK